MISLNMPIGDGSAELMALYGVDGRVEDGVDAADELQGLLKSLQPVERTLLIEVHSGSLSIDEAAKRLGKTPLAITRILRTAERKAKGRKRSSGSPAPGAGIERPVGTIRIRKWHDLPVRFIKVRNDGPASKRWKPYATWLWEQKNGPKPKGKCVLHKDGNTLNDSDDNLILGGHADRAYLFQSRSEANFKRSMAACHEGAARHNRERAIARDLAGELRETKWYAVDHIRHEIIGPLGRKLHEACELYGVPTPVKGTDTSPSPWLASQLGWPNQPLMVALTLAAMATRFTATWSRHELCPVMEAIIGQIGRPIKITNAYLNQSLYCARQRRLVESKRNGCLASSHRLTQTAIDERGPVCLLAFLRGSNCLPFKDTGYQVVPLREEATS